MPGHIARAIAKLRYSLGSRARVRRTEAPYGAVYSHRRNGPCAHQDRHGQPCLQLPALRMALGARCASIARNRGAKQLFCPENQGSEAEKASPYAPKTGIRPFAPPSGRKQRVLRGVQFPRVAGFRTYVLGGGPG